MSKCSECGKQVESDLWTFAYYKLCEECFHKRYCEREDVHLMTEAEMERNYTLKVKRTALEGDERICYHCTGIIHTNQRPHFIIHGERTGYLCTKHCMERYFRLRLGRKTGKYVSAKTLNAAINDAKEGGVLVYVEPKKSFPIDYK